jgi:hypothetical protein
LSPSCPELLALNHTESACIVKGKNLFLFHNQNRQSADGPDVPVSARTLAAMNRASFSTLQVLVLQTMDSFFELSESTRLDGIFPLFETSDGTLGNSGVAREKLSGKLFRVTFGEE